MRRLLVALLALSLAAPIGADQQDKAIFVTGFDVDDTSYTYCVTTGENNSAWGDPRPGGSVVSASASTTVAATTADTLPFTFVDVGDVLYFKSAIGVTSVRYVTAKASGDSITVNASITLVASGFTWREVTCGTDAASGWIPVAGWGEAKINTYVENLSVDASGIDVIWECRDLSDDTQVIIVYPATNYTAEGSATGRAVVITEPWDECRVGFKVADDDATDTGADIEIVHATITVSK